MTHSDAIIEKLRALKPTLQKDMGIRRLRVFGSVARGEAGPDSDVDLIADFDVMPGLLAFVGIKQGMEDALERRVDLLTENSLDKYIRTRVLREAQDVF